MDCEKVRGQFSSFWEKELSPSEETAFKEHLSLCPRCQRESEQFAKTMRWLHSAGDVEVPEEFPSEFHKRLEEKKRGLRREKVEGRWFHFPISFKLPAQAVAMVAVVFLVLYFTKMIPTGRVPLEETRQIPSPSSLEERPEGALTRSATPSPSSDGEVEKRRFGSPLSEPLPSVRQSHRPEQSHGTGREVEASAQKEVKDKRSALGIPTETPRPKDVEQARAPVPKERLSEEVPASRIKALAKKGEAPVRSPDAFEYQAVDSKKVARASAPSPEPGKMERELASREKPFIASVPPQEITLRISDRKKVIPLLRDLVKQFGGELVTTQEDMFLVSLPAHSFSGFKKELAGISTSSGPDRMVAKKQAVGNLGLEEGMKGKESDERSKGPAKLAGDMESRTIVRIFLIEQ